jgi:hypothetical protein
MTCRTNSATATTPAITPTMPSTVSKPAPPRVTAVAASIWVQSHPVADCAAVPKERAMLPAQLP